MENLNPIAFFFPLRTATEEVGLRLTHFPFPFVLYDMQKNISHKRGSVLFC